MWSILLASNSCIANTPIFHSVKPHAQQSLHTPAGFIRPSVETLVFLCCWFRLWNPGEALLPLFEVAEMGLESPARPLWEIWGCLLCSQTTIKFSLSNNTDQKRANNKGINVLFFYSF